jgi:hypothetical protein
MNKSAVVSRHLVRCRWRQHGVVVEPSNEQLVADLKDNCADEKIDNTRCHEPPLAPRKMMRMSIDKPRLSKSGFRTLSMSAATIHQTRRAIAFAVLIVAKA